MILGFTGTRNPISYAQKEWLRVQLADHSTLHHGACQGADEAAHWAAIYTGGYHVVVHPPKDQRLMMSLDGLLGTSFNRRGLPNSVTTLPVKPYLDRNRDIVDACEQLLALPEGEEKPSGGTWYTVRYAMGKVPIKICYPDGSVEKR